MNIFHGLVFCFDSAGPLPGNQVVKIVTIGAVSTKILLVEKSLDSTSEADLVRVLARVDGPAHVLVPAAPQNRDRCSGQPRCHDAEWP